MKLFYGAGINENQYPHPSEASAGSYNFDLQKDTNALRPRRPCDLKGTATNGGDIRGLLQLIKRDATQTTLAQAGAAVYKWDGGSTFSSVATLVTSTAQLRDVYWSLDDWIICTDLQLVQPVMNWDGTTFDTHVVDLGAAKLYAKYGLVHNNRVWLANIREDSTYYPHMVVASDIDDSEAFDTTLKAPSGTSVNSTAGFYILTPDLKPINGMVEFHGDVIISTEDGQLFKLTGSSTTDYAWEHFYPRSAAIGNEGFANAGNDLFYIRTGGNIESLRATEKYGDNAADDISRWIPDTVAGLTDAIVVYDQGLQKVLFFVEDKILVLFKDILLGGAVLSDKGDKGPLSPWSIYKTGMSTMFNTSCARYMRRPGETTHSVYFGDSAGKIYDLNGDGASGDAGANTIQMVRGTRFLEDLGYIRKIPRGRVQYLRIDECDFNITIEFSDEYSASTATVRLKGGNTTTAYYFGDANYFSGSVYFGTADTGDRFLSHQNFSNVGRGRVVTTEVSSDTNVRYQVNHVELL